MAGAEDGEVTNAGAPGTPKGSNRWHPQSRKIMAARGMARSKANEPTDYSDYCSDYLFYASDATFAANSCAFV